MAKQQRDFSLIIWVFGWLLDVATRLRKIIQETGVTFEAFERLGTDAGEATLRRIVHVIYEDHLAHLERIRGDSLSKLNPNPARSGFVDVPDLSARDLVELAERELGVEEACEELRLYDFYRDEQGQEILGRGRRYEYRWIGTRELPPTDPELPPRARNVAAFLAWLIQQKPEGIFEEHPVRYDSQSGPAFKVIAPSDVYAAGTPLSTSPPEGDCCEVRDSRFASFSCREVPKI